MYYRICAACGAALDPGEVCDCVGTMPQDADQAELVQNYHKMEESDNGYHQT